MQRLLLKSKIHGAVITGKRLDYEGSIRIDAKILTAADIAPLEKVQVLNANNGARFETYAIAGRAGSGVVELNGSAARSDPERGRSPSRTGSASREIRSSSSSSASSPTGSAPARGSCIWASETGSSERRRQSAGEGSVPSRSRDSRTFLFSSSSGFFFDLRLET